MTAYARILVRLPNWLGDLMLARPLLHGLRRAQPGARVLAVAPEPLLALARLDGAADEVVPWRRGRGGAGEATAAARRFRPEAAVVLPASFSSAWLAWRSGAGLRIGYRGDLRSPLLTHALARGARGELHLSREFLALGEPLGVTAADAPALAPDAPARDAVAVLLAGCGVAPGVPYALVGPRSAWGPAREWDAERFAAVGRALGERGLRVLVSGTAGERETVARVAAGIGAAAVPLAGRTDLPALVALCAGAAIAVCNDSGLAHVAAATGTPTVQIYGSASSAWTHALGSRARVVQRPPVCSPCWQRTCRIGYACLAAVTPELVLRACDDLLRAEKAS